MFVPWDQNIKKDSEKIVRYKVGTARYKLTIVRKKKNS